MATIQINIAGRPVNVDEKFKSLSPADQQKTVNEIAAQMGVTANTSATAATAAPVQPEEQGSGVLQNVAAAGNSVIQGTLALPGTVMYGAYNLLTQNPMTSGLGLPAAPTSEDVKKQWEGSFASVGVTPPSEVKAVTPLEKIARFGTEGVLMTLAPELMAAKLAQAGITSGRMAEILGSVFGQGKTVGGVTKNALIGGTATVAGETAAENAPEQWKPTVAMLAAIAAGGTTALAMEAPAATRSVLAKTGEFFDPMRGKTGQEREAGRQIIQSARDVDQLVSSLRAPTPTTVSGVKPTLAEMTGDTGLAAAEKKAAKVAPEAFAARQAEVGAAREATLRGTQTTGDIADIVPAAQRYLEKIETMKDDLDAATLKHTDEITDKLVSGAIDKQEAGESIRASLDANRRAVREAEGALHKAVDPDGKLRTAIDGVKAKVDDLRSRLKGLSEKPTDEEKKLFRDITAAPEVAPYSQLVKFQQRIGNLMRTERFSNGSSPLYQRLAELNKATFDQLNDAVLVRVTKENDLLQAGRIDFGETLQSKLSQLRDAMAQQDIEGGSTPRLSADELARGAVEKPSPRAVGPAEAEYIPPRVQRGQSVELTEDPEAILRLRGAKQATVERVKTFDNQFLRPLLRRDINGQEYKLATDRVAGNIFNNQIDSGAKIEALRAAIGKEEADRLLEGYALDRISEKVLKDGAVEPKALDAWVKNHSDALQAMPELRAKVENASTATKTVLDRKTTRAAELDAEKSNALGQFLTDKKTNALIGNNPKAVQDAVGSIVTGRDAVTKLKALRKAIGTDANALEGLHKAVVENITDKFMDTTGGVPHLKAKELVRFVDTHEDALIASGLTREQITGMKNLGKEAVQFQELAASAAAPETAVTLLEAIRQVTNGQAMSLLNRYTLRSLVRHAARIAPAVFLGAGAYAIFGDVLITLMREQGMKSVDQLVAKAMLDPDLARTLVLKVTPKNKKVVENQFRRALLRSTAAGAVTGANASDEKND